MSPGPLGVNDLSLKLKPDGMTVVKLREEAKLKNKALTFAVVLVLLLGAFAGIALFTQRDSAEPDAGNYADPQIGEEERSLPEDIDGPLKLVTGLIKNHYHAGELIWASLDLSNLEDKPLTFRGADPALSFKVYDDENRVVISQMLKLQLDEFNFRPDEVYHREQWFGSYVFALDQPGRYKVVACADLNLDENLDDPLYTYAEPVWIEIVTGRKTAFRPVEWRTKGTVPEEVRSWVEDSLKFDMGHFANAQEFDGKQYLFARSGTGGFEPFERLIEIIDVLVMEEEVAVRVSFTRPSPDQQIAPEDLYDAVYIEATGLPVRFVPIADEWIFISSLSGIHYLPDIVAHSRSIKLFAPAPGEVVGRKFSAFGVANTFEATVDYSLSDANLNTLDGGFITAGDIAPGFTREPVIQDKWAGAGNWRYFTIDIQVSEHVADGADLRLSVLDVCRATGSVDLVAIPLKFKSD